MEILGEIVLSRFIDYAQRRFETWRNVKRIYVYGAGRVGKSSFVDKLTKPRWENERIIKEHLLATINREQAKYTSANSDYDGEYKDLVLKFYSHAGQEEEQTKADRIAYFREIRPDAVIFIASPIILTDATELIKIPPTYKSALRRDLMIEENKNSLKELHALLQSNTYLARNCKMLLPIVSFRDLWRATHDYQLEFKRAYHDELQNIGRLGIHTDSKWLSYSLGDKASLLNVLDELLKKIL